MGDAQLAAEAGVNGAAGSDDGGATLGSPLAVSLPSLPLQAEFDQATEDDDQVPTGDGYASREPSARRRCRINTPFLHVANGDELENHHVDSGDGNERHFEPEHRIREVLRRPGRCCSSAGNHRQDECSPSERQNLP